MGTNILSEVPWIGNALKKLLRGGSEMGTLTLSRFFVLHVFLIPALIFAFVAMHVYSFRKAGGAGPVITSSQKFTVWKLVDGFDITIRARLRNRPDG